MLLIIYLPYIHLFVISIYFFHFFFSLIHSIGKGCSCFVLAFSLNFENIHCALKIVYFDKEKKFFVIVCCFVQMRKCAFTMDFQRNRIWLLLLSSFGPGNWVNFQTNHWWTHFSTNNSQNKKITYLMCEVRCAMRDVRFFGPFERNSNCFLLIKQFS